LRLLFAIKLSLESSRQNSAWPMLRGAAVAEREATITHSKISTWDVFDK
jgi:hypothetical protein